MERRAQARSAPATNDMLERLVASMNGIVWEADVETSCFTFVSEAAQHILGYAAADWLVPGFWEAHLHVDDRDSATSNRRSVVAERRSRDFEYRMLKSDGRTVWLRELANVVVDDDSKAVLCGIMLDISHTKQREIPPHEREELHRLRESEREFRAHFELAGVGQAQADITTGRLLRVNRKLCDLLGYSEEELLTSNFAELTHPDDRQRELSLFHQLVKGEIPELVIEKRMIRKDGAEVWVRITASLIYDDHGRPLRSVAIGEDVTLRKRAEQALLESHSLLNTVIEGTSDAIFVKDLEGRYRLINSAGARFLGRAVADVLGKRRS